MATAKKATAAEKAAPARKAAPAKKSAPASKTAAVKEAAVPVNKRTPNEAFMKAMVVSDPLAAVIGKGPYPRTEVTKKVWEYIKKHKLQDEVNKRMINADDKLKAILMKPQVSMFEMTRLINGHLS